MQQSLPFDTAASPGASYSSVAPPSAVPPSSRVPESGELVFVRHPKARRYVIRVRADGTIRITIPRWGSKRAAKTFADSERAWIDRQLAKVAAAAVGRREETSPDAARL